MTDAGDGWIVRGARVVVDDRRFSYHGETGVVLSRTKFSALVRLDAGDTVTTEFSHIRPEASLGDR